MKKLAILAVGLTLIGCGSGLNSTSDTSIPPTTFVGDYSFRDTNCAENVQSFRLTSASSTTMNLTVLDHGNDSTAQNGDIILGCELFTTQGGNPGLDCESVGGNCSGALVTSQALATQYANLTTLTVQNGDLVSSCGDDSADGRCYSVYRHVN